MAIPYQMWWTFIILAVICTAYSWLAKDRNNYTDAITGVIATLLWFVTGISCLLGIQAENMAFTAGWLMWIFVVFGVIEAILTIVKILDIITSRRKQNYTSLDPINL